MEYEWPRVPQPEDIRVFLDTLPSRTLVVIDELDRVDDPDALSLLADTIKTLADHSVESTLMLVGVAESVAALVGEHESIVRSLTQVPMPRMTSSELGDLLNRGFAACDLSIDTDATERIVYLAEGLPHFAHLLGLYSGQSAVQDDRDQVEVRDVDRAISKAVDNHSTLHAYQQATRSPQQGHLYEEVLLACAFALRDELGDFRAGDVREPLSRITNRDMQIPNFQRHLNEFLKPERGPALQKAGSPRHFLYRFRDPLLQPYVKLRALDRGLITIEQHATLQRAQAGTGGDDELTLFGETIDFGQPS